MTPTPRTWCSPRAPNLVMVGVNVTTPTILDAASQARIAASDLPHARFAWRILDFYLDFYQRFLGERVASLHDPLAAGILRDPSYITAVRGRARGHHRHRPGRPRRGARRAEPGGAAAAHPRASSRRWTADRFVADLVDAPDHAAARRRAGGGA